MKSLNSKLTLCCLSFLFFLQIQSIAQPAAYEMLVSSRNTNSVKRFNAQTGAYIDDFISSGSGGLSTPQDVIGGPGMYILVSGRGNTSVLMYDKSTGNFIGTFTTGHALNNPTKIAFGPDGNLYVSQWATSNQHIARFNGISGEFINELSPPLNLPLGQTWDDNGNLYVACYGSGDVRKFDPMGNYLGIFTGTGHLQGPTNLWFDRNGNLFVVDWDLGSVVQFDAHTGAFIRIFISGLLNAEGYSYGQDSNLYVCDWTRNQVRKYTPDGIFISVFADQGNMQAPNSILFRESNVISVGEETNLITDNFMLEQNYPNPFNPSTKIKFSIPNKEFVELKIFNISGKEVSVLVNRELKPGNYEYEWTPMMNLPSGLYLYNLTSAGSRSSGKYSITKKMLFVK